MMKTIHWLIKLVMMEQNKASKEKSRGKYELDLKSYSVLK